MTVRNEAPNQATNVSVVDTLPANGSLGSITASQRTFTVANGKVTFSVGSLAMASTATLTIVRTPGAAGSIRYTATVAGFEIDPDPVNNTTCKDVNVLPWPVTVPKVAITSVKSGKKSEKAIVLSLSGTLSGAAAQNVALYQLFSGRKVKRSTNYDRPIKLKSATYDPVANTGTLRTRTALNVSQVMQLRIHTGALLDSFGRPLDGDHDGKP